MAEDASALENSSAEALVSMKEGKGNSFQSSPRRGHPVRIRKPNPRIFGDDEESRFTPRPRKQPKPQKNVLSTPDKKAAQSIGVRLRNLLKLPKAHKWVCYEWFYSNIDSSLFLGENDFCICLKQAFPQLKTRKLTCVQWCKIRRLMGKPRRCSSAFFAEERAGLLEKREKIRMLQQRKSADITDFKDLPDEIPTPLVIGTKVTARLRKPQDGLFTGAIDALDTVNSTYRVTFDRPNLGTHSVPDIEVLSNEPQETIPLTAFQSRQRPNRSQLFTPPRFIPGDRSPGLISDHDPYLGSSPVNNKSLLPIEEGTLGGFPVKFLILVTKLTKILTEKREKIKELKDMNTQAEKMKSQGETFELPFQQKYASLVLELETLNKDLNEYLVGVQHYCQEVNTVAPDHGVVVLDQPQELKRQCEQEAEEMVCRNNMAPGRKMVRSERTLGLITKLTALMLQVKTFAENDMQSFEFKSLQDSLREIQNCLDPSNISVFQNNVEVHMNHIQSGLTQLGNLHAFAAATEPVNIG